MAQATFKASTFCSLNASLSSLEGDDKEPRCAGEAILAWKSSIKWPKHHKAIPCYHINAVSCANTHPKQEMINNAIPATIIYQNESTLPVQVPSTSINHRRLGVVSLWVDRGLEAAAANTRWRIQPCLAAKMVTWSLFNERSWTCVAYCIHKWFIILIFLPLTLLVLYTSPCNSKLCFVCAIRWHV